MNKATWHACAACWRMRMGMGMRAGVAPGCEHLAMQVVGVGTRTPPTWPHRSLQAHEERSFERIQRPANRTAHAKARILLHATCTA